MADCMRLICNNVANALGGELIGIRLPDMMGQLFDDVGADDADAEEIIERITSGLAQLGDNNDECI